MYQHRIVFVALYHDIYGRYCVKVITFVLWQPHYHHWGLIHRVATTNHKLNKSWSKNLMQSCTSRQKHSHLFHLHTHFLISSLASQQKLASVWSAAYAADDVSQKEKRQKGSSDTTDSHGARMTWCMQNNYRADILRRRGAGRGISASLMYLWLFISC